MTTDLSWPLVAVLVGLITVYGVVLVIVSRHDRWPR